jgi:hypothetical protein
MKQTPISQATIQVAARYDIFIKGTMTAATPVSYSAPNISKRVNKIEMHALPTLSGRLFVPASAIRGKLRHFAADIYRAGRKCKDLRDYFVIYKGGVHESKGDKVEGEDGDKKEDKSSDKAVYIDSGVRAVSPLLSLFGGLFPITVSGRLQPDHAIVRDGPDGAIKPETINHVRSDDTSRNVSTFFERFDSEQAEQIVERRNRFADSKGRKLRIDEIKLALRKIKDKESEEYKALEVEKTELEALEKGAATQSVSQLLQYDAIPQGSVMDFGFRLIGVTKDEAHLFFAALEMWSFNPVIGARLNHGNGLVAVDLKANVRPAGQPVKPAELGSVSWNADFEGATVSDSLATWLGETPDWSQYLISSKDIEASGLPTKAAKAKKGDKEVAEEEAAAA